jgi:hypothetical protein
MVDASDYVVWRNSLGQAGPGLAADGNGDGKIDPGDYDVWRANFGKTAGSGAVVASVERLSAAIPEPVTLWISVIAIVMMQCCRPAKVS